MSAAAAAATPCVHPTYFKLPAAADKPEHGADTPPRKSQLTREPEFRADSAASRALDPCSEAHGGTASDEVAGGRGAPPASPRDRPTSVQDPPESKPAGGELQQNRGPPVADQGPAGADKAVTVLELFPFAEDEVQQPPAPGLRPTTIKQAL